MYPQQIIDALEHVRYPGTGKNLIESGMLEDDIHISGMEVSFSIIFEKDNDPFRKSVVKAAETAIPQPAEGPQRSRLTASSHHTAQWAQSGFVRSQG